MPTHYGGSGKKSSHNKKSTHNKKDFKGMKKMTKEQHDRFLKAEKDGLYYWKFNKDEYTINIGGRNDRGKNEYQDVVYINNEFIKNYNDLSFPEGYWK